MSSMTAACPGCFLNSEIATQPPADGIDVEYCSNEAKGIKESEPKGPGFGLPPKAVLD